MGLPSIQTRMLICQLSENQEIVTSENVTMTSTLLTCLSEATQRDFELILVNFSTRPISKRSGIIELFTCLKNSHLTGETPLFASMETLHRDMIVKMKNAGVNFLKIHPPKATIAPEQMLRVIQSKDASVGIDRFLARLCPFLNYSAIDDQVELITCRAYRNRMVLGGKRLHEICETEGYLHCEYYLNPRVKR